MQLNIHKQFIQSLWWNTIEAIPYQFILTLHQIALFGVVGKSMYGLIGTVFSLIFLSVGVANLGFDAFLPSFSAQAFTSRKNFAQLLGWHCVPTLVILTLLTGATASNFLFFPTFHNLALSTTIVTYSICLIWIESFKKVARAVLHHAFYNKQTALIELFQIVAYTLLIWTSRTYHTTLSLDIIIGGLCLVSLLCTLALGYYVVQFYTTLPATDNSTYTAQPVQKLVYQRWHTALISFGHQFFSGNTLVPLFAYHFGLSYAGTLKLIGSVAQGATVCVQKIFGSAGDALFAHTKHGSLDDKKQAFSLITHHLYAALYGILLFLIGATLWLWSSQDFLHNNDVIMCALVFFVMYISEQFFSAYERFFIAQGRAYEVMIFTACTLLSLYAIWHYTPITAPITMLKRIVALRVVSFFIVGGVSFSVWHIRPTLHIHPAYFIGSLLASLVVFLIAM